MKKGKKVLILLCIMLISFNTSLYAEVLNGVNLDGGNNIIRPYTDYISNWYTTSAFDNISVAGYDMPARIEVKVINGLFVKDRTMGANEAALILDGVYANQGIYVNSVNCQISATPSWQRLDGGKYWNTAVRVTGTSESYFSSTLTKTEATKLLLSGGVEFKIKGVGVKTKSDLEKAYGTTTSQTVSYKLDSSYNSIHDVDMHITGLGSINVLIN